jgi:Ni/Fe-hydrogenase subunit HybB-like protein
VLFLIGLTAYTFVLTSAVLAFTQRQYGSGAVCVSLAAITLACMLWQLAL